MTVPPHASRARLAWQRLTRRASARAVKRIAGLVAGRSRLSGLALRELLDRRFPPGTLCLVPFSDHSLYVDPRDDKVALTLLSGKAWQRRQLDTAIATLRAAGDLRGSVFLDVGANIGTQTVYAMLSGAFDRAIAVEPDPHNFGILVRNLALNSLEGHVAAVRAAASESDGRLLLARHRRNFGAHSVEAAFVTSPSETIEVRSLALDRLLQDQNVSPARVGLVKIDVEGHEASVLAGMPGLRRRRVPIMVELTADRRDPARLSGFKAMLDGYTFAVDLTADRGPIRLADLVWDAEQMDILVY